MTKIILISTLLILSLATQAKAYQVQNNPFRRAEVLDPDGKYLLEWEVDWSSKRITFNVSVETRNWVGFGLANDGISSGSDLVIGGVKKNGQPYFSDRHTIGASTIPILDKHPDWTLHSAWESKTHTVLCFSRALDTCDPQDYPLTINVVGVHWSYGKNDNEDGHNPQKKGTVGLHLLDPDYAPQIIRRNGAPVLITSNSNENIPKDTKAWSVQKRFKLPTNRTAYFCSIHKAPRLKQNKHHFIGYDIHFGNEESQSSTHHILIYRCHSTPGVSLREMFEPHLQNPGEPCYLNGPPLAGSKFPGQYCTELFTGWAIGGKAFFLPNHVGYPFGETEDEYFKIQLHYDNPLRSRIEIDLRLDFFYTSQIRPNEGGLFGIATDLPGLPESILVPPNSRDYRIFSHCGPACTERILPSSGMMVSAVNLHAHNSAKGMRLRHFRGDRELPWILYDDNYNNQIQPVRHLRNEVKVLPGDHLVLECHYTNNGTTTVGGYTTSQEMCNAFLIHYRRIKDYSFCSSGIHSKMARQEFLGIQNISWVQSELEWVVQTPPRLAGLKVSQVSDFFVDWTPEKRRQLERFHIVHPHSGGCNKDFYARTIPIELSGPTPFPPSGLINTVDDYRGPVSYPFQAVPYSPPGSHCPHRKG